MNDKVKVIIAVVLLAAAIGLVVWYMTRGSGFGSGPATPPAFVPPVATL